MTLSDSLHLATAARAAGRLNDAFSIYSRLVDASPGDARLRHDLAMLLADMNRLPSALVHLREAHRLQPKSAEICNNLGGMLVRMNRIDDAIDAYRKAVAIAPGTPLVQYNLGDALRVAGKLPDAIVALRIAATLDPNLHEAWSALGTALVASGLPRAALGALRRAVELKPDHADSWRRLGDALIAAGAAEDAAGAFQRAVALEPDRVENRYGLARARISANHISEAIAEFEECLRLQNRSWHERPAHVRSADVDEPPMPPETESPATPNEAVLLHELSKAHFQLGSIEKAMAILRQITAVDSEESRTLLLQNLAVIVPGSPADDNRSILETRRAYAARFPSAPPMRRSGGRSKTIRIGYISSFFHRKNWMKPVWPLINHHDRGRFQIHLFSDAPAEKCAYGYKPDPRDRFHDITGLSNKAAAKKIADQQVDILIDLNGFSEPNRLNVFTFRPAPIQAAWFNMYATSGMGCFDYLIGDEHVIPADEEPLYTERIVRVANSYLTFHVDYPVPDVTELPALKNGRITIGCLASQYKIADCVVEAWAEILRRSPNAQLLIRNEMLGREEHQAHLAARFAHSGIPRDRLILEGPADHFEFLATYGRIDFAIDTFPYSGGTTTTEALWQGVPVVTFNGDRWVSRTSASLLKAAGLGEFVASNRDGYVAMCVDLANSPSAAPERLATLRADLRRRLRESPVCDIPSFARAMEDLYVRMI